MVSQNYYLKYGLDIRSVRYPGIIGYQSDPGGGTTDYAVDIYHKAILGENYTCFLQENTALPMIYMEDAIRATLELMEAPAEKIKLRTSYNLSGMSFSPIEIAAEIQQHYPNFAVNYEPDFRQQIAESWPNSIDDTPARMDWDWQPKFDLAKMTTDMILNLQKKYEYLPNHHHDGVLSYTVWIKIPYELEEEKNRENYYFLRHDRHTDQVNYILDPQWYRESSKKKNIQLSEAAYSA